MTKEAKHLVNFTTRHVEPGEEVVATAEDSIGKAMGSEKGAQQNGTMIIASTRAGFYRKGWLGEILQTVPLKGLTSLERKSLLGHSIIRLHTSHDPMEFRTFDKDTEAGLDEAIDAGRQVGGAPRDIATSPEAGRKLAK